MPGEFAARKLAGDRQKFKWKSVRYINRVRRKARKAPDPLQGAPQGTGIVIEKTSREQKQPSSGLIKVVRVQLRKNGKMVTAHVPKSKSITFIDEHDEVFIEGLGGSQGGAIGTMWGTKYKVTKVNGVALSQIRKGKKEKPRR